ncbi:MAG: DUF5107 domain-containing protein [Muribaculaceae bacterium]|nr:DUF5107 domain-containing protein [Muribaculaceae bacterium]
MAKAWKEKVVIPTYEIGEPEKNPIFLEKRVYQGSSGVVYPYPVIESISDEKTDHEWNAVFIENEYIKVMILPELGGRVQMAYDKIKQRHFVYYNHVIKPALVGLAGPWISGGIEFNWPQHHRPSTYMPVDCTIEEHADGSVTVWVNEIERMFHQKGMAGFTLRPGCAYLEIKGVLYNRTDVPQTFLWWANPAVAVNEHYRSVFPPDINAVFDHGKRAVSSFPIATGTYYKMDYSAGVDIANYKNIFVPTSYMGVNSKYDFEGGYENDTQAGMLHVASHHVSPGKKQWTWGNGDFGRAWDRCLTDDDGPYIELMAGVYTENQPDFTWLMPYEEKEFTQFFLPYRELGVVKNATKDLLMNIEPLENGKVHVKVFATSAQNVYIRLTDDSGREFFNREVDITPENIFEETIDVEDTDFDRLTLYFIKDGIITMTWHAEPDEIRPIPDAAEPALLPNQIKTVEQLYLTGLHLEQYRHATYSPLDYYEEGLRRDPDDVRCNNAVGLWYIRKGRFDLAEKYLEKAVKMLQKRNPNPYDGEPIYNLGLALKYQGRLDEAYNRFYKSTWNGAWQDAGYFACAQISCLKGNYQEALYEADRSLRRNWHNGKARSLKAAILSRMNRTDEMVRLCKQSLEIDRFNYGCLFLLDKYDHRMTELMHGNPHNYDELALEYADAGLWKEASEVWKLAEDNGATTPMTYYYLGWVLHRSGDTEGARKAFDKGARECPDMVFPNRLEAILALSTALELNSGDACANHYLGNLFYDKRQYDLSHRHWERAAELNPLFPTTWRNLALVYFNKLDDKDKALECMERAFSLDEEDSRVLMELDQLYKKLQRPHDERLAFLQKYPNLIEKRDDLVLEEIILLNQTGKYGEAKEKLDRHIFHPWEGGEGKVPTQYQIARVEIAKRAIAEGNYIEAIALLKECLTYPDHLGEGKLYGAQENDFYYLLGVCYKALGMEEAAKESLTLATLGPTEPAAAMYYNDAKPDKIFYAGLAFRALGQEDKARAYFNRLVEYGKQHLYEKQRMDYFAVSLPDLQVWDGSMDEMNRIHCLYMLSLGYDGLGDTVHSDRYLKQAEAMNINHQGIQSFKTLKQIRPK